MNPANEQAPMPPPAYGQGGGAAAYPPQQPGAYPPQQPGAYPPPQQPGAYPPLQQQPGAYPPLQQQPGAYPPPPQGYPAPVHQQQPQQMAPVAAPGATMLALPGKVDGCPPGLEHFAISKDIFVKQKVDLLEAASDQIGCCYEGKNEYTIMSGDQSGILYRVEEESGLLQRVCCRGDRGFEMNVFDNANQNILHLERPFKCPLACFPFFLQEINVSTGGNKIGSIKQPLFGGLYKMSLHVVDNDDNLKYKIESSPIVCALSDATFHILDESGNSVGQIVRKFDHNCESVARNMLTDSDNFHMTFPEQATPEIKALLFAGMMMVDFMFFESGGAANAASCEVRLCSTHCCGCTNNCVCDVGECMGGGEDN